jgi:uncharacterized membrane protein HdeD (DUF308 family)
MTTTTPTHDTSTLPERHRAAIWFIVEGALLIIFGVLAAALPAIAGFAAALAFGWMLILAGILGFVAFFASRPHAHPLWSIVSALAALVAGGFVVWSPIAGAVALALFVAAYLLVDAVALIALAFDQRRRQARSWGWLAAAGVVDLILGAFIIVLGPLSDLVLIGFVVALDLAFAGIALVALGMAARRAA